MKYQRIKDKFFYFNYLFYDFKFIGNKHLISYSRSDKIALFQPVAKRIYIYRKKKRKKKQCILLLKPRRIEKLRNFYNFTSDETFYLAKSKGKQVLLDRFNPEKEKRSWS